MAYISKTTNEDTIKQLILFDCLFKINEINWIKLSSPNKISSSILSKEKTSL